RDASRADRPVCSATGLVTASRPSAPAAPAVLAAIETILATGGGQIRQFAFDGDSETFFASAAGASAGDSFTLRLDSPVRLVSVAVVTGRPDGSDRLDAGTLEVSTDGKEFREIGKFADGAARAAVNEKAALALRIRPSAEQAHPLAIREITVISDPAVTIFKF